MEEMILQEFAQCWYKLSKDMKVHLDTQLSPSLTEGQFHVLEFLLQHDKVKPSDFISYLSTTPAAVTTILDRMEKSELISRERDSHDRRIVWIHMSGKGKQEVERGMKIREAFLQDYLSRISSHNQQLLVYLLKKITSEPQTKIV